MGQRRSNANEIIGGTTPKTYQSPTDSSPYNIVNWSWPYTGSGSGQIFRMGLVSYAPNLRLFGNAGSKCNGWAAWTVMWHHSGAGWMKVGGISDGTSNTMAVIEKQMVAGPNAMFYRDWGIQNGGNNPGGAPYGIQMWATTDTPEMGLPVFGITCKDPAQTWDNNYGQWWLNHCRFGTNAFETFQPVQQRPVPAQQSAYTVYPLASGGSQCLMMDGGVRTIRPGISVLAWSAGITPAGGEVAQFDN